MAYMVDILVNTMKAISKQEPVMFQRDGALYVASEQGFGQVCFGLSVYPRHENDRQPELPDILESENIITGYNKSGRDSIALFKEGEAERVRHFICNPDHNAFTLESMALAATTLRALPDDGKIRIIGHEESYHSHKYGYDVDGMDFWVDAARVIDRERYFDLLRKQEDKKFSEIERFRDEVDAGMVQHPHTQHDRYHSLRWPNAVLLTPEMMMCFPEHGFVIGPDREHDSWTEATYMYHRNRSSMYYMPSVLRYRDDSQRIFRENPFRVNLAINNHHVSAESNEGLQNLAEQHLGRLVEGLNAIEESDPEDNIAVFIAKCNDLHNQICARDIEWHKDLRKSNRVFKEQLAAENAQKEDKSL